MDRTQLPLGSTDDYELLKRLVLQGGTEQHIAIYPNNTHTNKHIQSNQNEYFFFLLV